MPSPRKTPPRKASSRKTRKKPASAAERMRARRERLRAQGLRPVQHWVPDLRDPKVRAAIRREGALLSKHPENDAIDDWIESVVDWDDWK
jgi:nicotinamide mononucleotide adenylyltransferase